MARARAAVGRLDGKLATAQRSGDLKWFNGAYKAYRLDCVARGKPAMPYNAALAKLRAALASAAAGVPVKDLVTAAFDG